MKKQFMYGLIRKVVPGTGQCAGCHPDDHIGGCAVFRCLCNPVCSGPMGVAIARKEHGLPFHARLCRSFHYAFRPNAETLSPLYLSFSAITCPGVRHTFRHETEKTKKQNPLIQGILFLVTIKKKGLFLKENYSVSFVSGSETAGGWPALSGCSLCVLSRTIP
jgi:hypothetical protein